MGINTSLARATLSTVNGTRCTMKIIAINVVCMSFLSCDAMQFSRIGYAQKQKGSPALFHQNKTKNIVPGSVFKTTFLQQPLSKVTHVALPGIMMYQPIMWIGDKKAITSSELRDVKKAVVGVFGGAGFSYIVIPAGRIFFNHSMDALESAFNMLLIGGGALVVYGGYIIAERLKEAADVAEQQELLKNQESKKDQH